MPVSDSDLGPVKAISAALVEAGEGLFKWESDDRFGAALTTFKGAQEADVRAVLGQHLPAHHDVTTIADAPELAAQIARAFGGLRAGQELFFSDDSEAPMLVGAWWPWGNGATISLRVKLVVLGLSSEDKAALMDTFKGWFKI